MKKESNSPFRFSPNPNRANEINWHEWSEETFELAQRQNRPMLLDIGATWCHWCHVMDETSYSDSQIIQTLNEDYIPIRVDNDQHPEINSRYNQGGWPSIAFLTPKGELITGGTYIPPAQMRAYLIQVRDYYHQHEAEIDDKIKQFALKRDRLIATDENALSQLTPAIPESIGEIILSKFDRIHGGFGTEPKFPHPAVLSFALEQRSLTGDIHWETAIEKTLAAMSNSGMFDHIDNGFFRYSTTRDWTIPHFEKMLEDNVLLLDVYLQAFQITGNEGYKGTANKTIDFLNTTLLDQKLGVYQGSQEANEEYFHLDRKSRAKRPAPGVDHIIYTDWNALTSTGFVRAYNVLQDEDHLNSAVKILEFLLDNCYSPQTGMYHYWNGTPNLPGLLIDQVRTLQGLLDVYEVTFDSKYLSVAQSLAEIVLRDFQSPSGGFFDISAVKAEQAHGTLRNREKFIDENAYAAETLVRLSRITGDITFLKAAESALDKFSGTYQEYGLFAAPFGLAVNHFLRPPLQVTIVGKRTDLKTKSFILETNRVYVPNKTVAILDPVIDKKTIDSLGYSAQSETLAYLCVADKCLPPVNDPDKIAISIKQWNNISGRSE